MPGAPRRAGRGTWLALAGALVCVVAAVALLAHGSGGGEAVQASPAGSALVALGERDTPPPVPAPPPAPVEPAPAPEPGPPAEAPTAQARPESEPVATPGRRRPRPPPPRVGISADGLAPAGAVPAAPRAALETPLGGCCSAARGSAPVDAIVVHTTEMPDRVGLDDLVRLGSFLRGSRRAAHVATDGEGNTSRLVPDERVAYHATYWNRTTLGIEQMGYAAFRRANWLGRSAQLWATARWIAHWARRYRIPIERCIVDGLRYNRRDRVVAGAILRRGICSHGELDPGNRSDPGAGYPWDVVLARARLIAWRADGGG